MPSPSRAAQPQLDAIAAALAEDLGEDGRDPLARGFGRTALKVAGRIFAMPADGTVVVKLPPARVAELIAAGRGRPFTAGKAKAMTGWLSLSPPDDDWLAIVREARAHVAQT